MDTIRIRLEGLGSQFESIYLRNKLFFMIRLIQLVGFTYPLISDILAISLFFARLSNRLEK